MLTPLVTIGIPAYNRPEGLSATLQCVTNQTYDNIEIIVSDDCSHTDGVAKVVNNIMLSESRIRFYRQPKNLGAISNFEFLVTKATGKYFLWADDEDLLEPDFVEKLVACMELHPSLIVCVCDIKTIDNDGNFIKLHQLDNIRPSANWDQARKLFFQYPISNIFFCNYGMFRTDILKRANIRYLAGWKGYMTNGEVTFLAQIATFGRIAAIPEALKSYRLNPNSIFHTEIRAFSRFDWLMLRLVIRYTLCKIAITSDLPILVKVSLLKETLITYIVANIRYVRVLPGRIMRLLKGEH
jgi:glycosyltransferase involved in cell wall biosynthesis